MQQDFLNVNRRRVFAIWDADNGNRAFAPSLNLGRMNNLALKAGKFWRKNSEISAGFLKRCATRRATQTCIDELEHPVTGTRCSSPTDLQDAAILFYQQLYTPEEIHQSSVDSLLEAVPTTCRIPDSVSGSLVRPFSTVDLIDAAKHCPNHSSPGPDGIPYQILLLVFEHNHASRIATQDDLTSLKNWRPISLINTDAKVFTRLLNARLMPHLNRLISLQQLGFMPGRFIGENGKLLNVVMSVAEKTSSQAIGLLLDQEKAYDRIHPEYLRQSMSVLGIPSAVIDSLCTLFFSTSIRINVNGHLSDSFIQQRGLRQGDPISPLLFNIAFDPFIRSMNTSPDIAGFKFPPLAQETNSSVSAIKIMAYADDTLSNASNALLNFGKTEAFSLSGSTLPLWRTYLQQLSPPITSWHDKSALSPLIYLGYPVYSSVTQRNQFVDQLLTKVKLSCQIHSQRSLSIRGRVAVLNTLIYSKLWQVLRVVPLTTTQLASFRSLGSAFLNNYRFPRIAYTALVPSRKVGGLGTLDPCIQQLTLQWRWVLPLLSGSSPTSVTASFSVQYIRAVLSFFTQGDYLRPLLFSQCRNGFSSLLKNPYKILFQAVDHLPKTFLQSRLNASTCVDLPLEYALISPDNLSLSPPSPSLLGSLFPNFPGIRKLVVGDIVVYDTLSRSLRLRFRSEYRRLPTLTHKVVRAIQERQLRVSPFLLRLCLPGLVPPETVEGPTNYVPLCTHSLQIVASFGTHLGPVAYRDYLLPSG
ncbi:hypothetical protein G6F26_002915 [Rhizopus arrhizus]|nr:hypothetical protein G6F26_002915 [Rhizopus arrhizus]KAG1073622.1 hypothetical protein G6F41_002454 [Rhizopus arrhizus]